MTARKRLHTIIGVISIFLITPIWYYLFYRILCAVDATNVMWLLYWIYVPIGLFISALGKIAEGLSDK